MTTKYQPGTRVSEYLLEECVGAGAFGEVWRARHHVWADQFVAVKLPVQPEYVRFLQREGVVVHGIRHPNVVRVLGLDPYAEHPYLIMELVKGPSLNRVIAEHPKGLPLDSALLITRGILNAMQAAHGAGVLHRDLKPGNVMLHLDGRALAAATVDDVKVSDFGLGVDSGDTLRSIAQSVSMERDSNQLVGTLAYMAPEIRENQRPHDPRSDLYAIGVMLFELLTGERPAGAEYPSTLRSDVPARLDEIFRKLYARYERRYESAAAVLADLPANAAAAAARAGSAPAAGADIRYRVVLQAAGANPINVIKVMRQAAGLGLAEARRLVDRVPATVLEGADERDAYGVAAELEQAGARASVHPEGRHANHPRTTPPPLPVGRASPQRRCVACEQPVEADDQFCMTCGKQLTPSVRRCPSCQGFPGPYDRFCIFCGTSLAPVAEA